MFNATHALLLEDRRLDVETLTALGARSIAPRGTNGGEWIAIPYKLNGNVVNHKYRTIDDGPKRFQQDANATKCFWNLDCLLDPTLADEPLIITEGEFDAAVLMQFGYQRVLSVPDGAPATAIGPDDRGEKYSYVTDARPLLRDVREIILCVDNDGPGENLLQDLAVRLGRGRCKFVTYPRRSKDAPPTDRCKDINETLCLHNERGVHAVIRGAQWMAVDGVYRMSQLPPVALPAILDPPGPPGLRHHYKLRLGDFAVITGIPGSGKTTLVNDICASLVGERMHDGRLVSTGIQGLKVAWASFEQDPSIDHRRALRRWFLGRKVAFDDRGDDLAPADDWIDRRFVFVVPRFDDEVSLEWVLERAATAVVQHGCQIIVIDPWNEMDHVRPHGMSLTEYTGFAIKRFKQFARNYRVHVIVVAHPAKPQTRLKDGSMPSISLYDISDSAHWANKADVGIVVERGDGRMTNVHIRKVRYQDLIGEPGTLELEFDTIKGRYYGPATASRNADQGDE
jgi:twinkle protein